MKRSIFGQLLLVVTLLLLCQSSFAQEQKYVTEQFFVPKSQCVIHAYDLEDFLKSKGLYGGQKTNYQGVGKLNWMKKKVRVAGVDFTKDCTFILELMGDRLPKDEEGYEFLGSFGIIEIGFATEAKAKEVCAQAKEISKRNPLNIAIYAPPFRCIHVGKSVLFVYSINVNMDKYLDVAEKEWESGTKPNDK